MDSLTNKQNHVCLNGVRIKWRFLRDSTILKAFFYFVFVTKINIDVHIDFLRYLNIVRWVAKSIDPRKDAHIVLSQPITGPLCQMVRLICSLKSSYLLTTQVILQFGLLENNKFEIVYSAFTCAIELNLFCFSMTSVVLVIGQL